jgi:COMPASS component SWD3
LVSGSFDKSIRIWDTSGSIKEVQILKKHLSSVSEVCWSPDSTELLSASFDHSCKTWDVEAGKLLESFDCDGFVQGVQFVPNAEANTFICGTSRSLLCMFDRRDDKATKTMKNNGMINTMYAPITKRMPS